MDPRDSADLPDHPEDPFQPAEQQAPPPPSADEDAEDFVDDEHEEDDEATLDEEEAMLLEDDDEDELDDLEAEADMDIEELRKKYGYGAPAAPSEDEPCASSTAEEAEDEEEQEEEEEEEAVNSEAIESAANDYFGVVEGAEGPEEEDVDYEPPEKKEFQIRVDPVLYQAEVPEDTEGADAHTYEHSQGTLLWAPNSEVSADALNRFVHEWKARQHGVDRDESKIDSRDDEDALFALLSSAYSTAAAAAAFPFTPANGCERTGQGAITFTAEEREAFEHGFKDNYKNFRVIRESFVPSRTVGELIDYYYHWKKTSRFNEFRQRVQRRDFMTEVTDQMESKRRREAEKAAADAAAQSATVIHSENNYEDEVEYEDPLAAADTGDELPPVDAVDVLWAAPPPPALPQQLEQPTESA